MERWEIVIGKFYEKHSVKIQMMFFIGALGLSLYFNISQDKQLGIVIGLLLLITGELISLSINDSLTRGKLNNMGVRLDVDRGRLFRVHDFDLSRFFDSAKSNFFASGIALNGLLVKEKGVIEKFLNEEKEIFILIVDPDAVGENAKLYHGENLDEKTFREKVNDIYHKQMTALNSLRENTKLFDFLENEKLKLRVSCSVMSTSFVAYDIFDNDKNKDLKELKASFYQYRCTAPEEEPNIIVDSSYNKDWYLFFKETIKKQWDDAKPIKNKEEFEKLCDEIEDKINENNKKRHSMVDVQQDLSADVDDQTN